MGINFWDEEEASFLKSSRILLNAFHNIFQQYRFSLSDGSKEVLEWKLRQAT